MIVARSPSELTDAFVRAAATAREAFGDDTLYLEAYVERARHLEVQVVGDGAGRVVHFGERDCSVQRRYQKMIEEAPAAVLPDGIRLRVRAEVLDETDVIAAVRGTSNILLLHTDLMGTVGTVSISPTVDQTAYGVFSDLVEIARSL